MRKELSKGLSGDWLRQCWAHNGPGHGVTRVPYRVETVLGGRQVWEYARVWLSLSFVLTTLYFPEGKSRRGWYSNDGSLVCGMEAHLKPNNQGETQKHRLLHLMINSRREVFQRLSNCTTEAWRKKFPRPTLSGRKTQLWVPLLHLNQSSFILVVQLIH